MQHDYGPDSQQSDVTLKELENLCSQFFEREVRVTVEQARSIEDVRKQQAGTPEWYHQCRLCLTASNFGRIARQKETTPIANLYPTADLLMHPVFRGEDA